MSDLHIIVVKQIANMYDSVKDQFHKGNTY